MKVAPFFEIYNFASKTKIKFQVDFELQIKINNNLKPNFCGIIFKSIIWQNFEYKLCSKNYAK